MFRKMQKNHRNWITIESFMTFNQSLDYVSIIHKMIQTQNLSRKVWLEGLFYFILQFFLFEDR